MVQSVHPRLSRPSKTLYLVDISSFIFRAFYAIRSLSNSRGEPTNAIYGVATMLVKLLQDAEAEFVGVVYDSKEPSFRKEIYNDYKANRASVPEDLIPQFDQIERLIRGFKIHSYRQSGVEADDLIATLALGWRDSAPGHEVVIVSSDKDLMQLVDDRICLWDTLTNRVFTPLEVTEKFGVDPKQIRDYLGLVGDSSDNIPGVPGVGPKTASDLLRDFGDLDSVLKAAQEGRIPGKKAEALRTNAELARLSAELATLHCELKVKADPLDLKYRFEIDEACVSLLREFEFHTLVAKWAPDAVDRPKIESPQAEATPQAALGQGELPIRESPANMPALQVVSGIEPGVFKTVNSDSALQSLLEGMERAGQFGFDLETTSLNPRAADLVGVAICYDGHTGHYIPVGHRGSNTEQLPEKKVLAALKPFLENKKYGKIGQNLKYDFSVLMQQGIRPVGIKADTMVAAYVLEPEGRHNLETLAANYLSYPIVTYEQVCGKGKDQLCFDQVSIEDATRYSGEDAWVAVQLWQRLEPRLKAEGVLEVFTEIDLPLVDILARMECQGVCIDEPWLRKLSKEFEKELAGIEERVQIFARKPINLNSPKQLAALLFEDLKLPVGTKTKTGYSTDAQVLESLAPLHEVPAMLLEYREISKLKGTYVDPLPTLRDAKTGKIHASFHQTVAATGRLSSSDPNLQNIPIRSDRGIKIRRAFIPSEGNVLISADYSQIELRLLAHMSGDPELVASFKKDEDVHRRTAGEIFGIPADQVTDRQRSIAKAINFGLMYGKTAFGLAQELKIPRREAQEVIDKYFQRYHRVKHFLDHQILEAREKGFICMLSGRKRHLPDIRSKNPAVRSNAERMAMNTPIQGTASDLVKIAMLHLDRELEKRKLGAKLIIQVHDELVLDCPKAEAAEVVKLVTQVMENAMQLSVPLKVNVATGENWMDL